MKLQHAFAVVLKDLRVSLGISQEELGFKANYHRTYISQLERGLKIPTLTTVFELAHVLKITPAEFIERVQQAFENALSEDGHDENNS
ncbi:helix-turn-helix transcriptional regulator [Herpetosiphon gulosus]|uniref:HTH cro/C1-type domain-containing protein n=1 Tax=Herpetosiphon gulosus TaxID=1973496 RepID=A0ABP9X297_9CHLR